MGQRACPKNWSTYAVLKKHIFALFTPYSKVTVSHVARKTLVLMGVITVILRHTVLVKRTKKAKLVPLAFARKVSMEMAKNVLISTSVLKISVIPMLTV